MSLSVAEAKSSGMAGVARKKKTFPEHVWEMLGCFRSVHLAIVLLSLLALAVLAGVLLPQENLVDPAEIKAQYGKNYRLFKAMGLFNVYSSYWFITLEVLFFFNLLLGSFQWLRPAFRAATRKTFCEPLHILASPNRFQLESALPQDQLWAGLQKVLRRHRYRVYMPPGQQLSETPLKLYATKGNFSRFGPVTAHFGILLLLIASVWGSFAGFTAQKLAVPGDEFPLAQVDAFMPNMPLGVWQGSIPDWKIRVDDFRIDYYANEPGTAKQFYADLTLMDSQDQVLKQQTVSVNHPMSYQDVNIYQASFAPTGRLFLELNGEPLTLETNTRFQDRPVSMSELPESTNSDRALLAFPFFVQQDPGVSENYIVLFLRDGEGFFGAESGKMPENLRLRAGESGTLGGMNFTFVRPEISTGLQIKRGPEVPLMYLSYLIIIAGAFMCIFSQRRLWIAVRPAGSSDDSTEDPKGQEILVHFKTNKARLSFMKELKALYGRMQQDLVASPTAPQAQHGKPNKEQHPHE